MTFVYIVEVVKPDKDTSSALRRIADVSAGTIVEITPIWVKLHFVGRHHAAVRAALEDAVQQAEGEYRIYLSGNEPGT